MPRGQGLTKLFNAPLNSPQKPNQTEEEQIDQKFNNLVETWLKDSSCDESYREILVSFDTMFRLVAHNNILPVSRTIIDGLSSLGGDLILATEEKDNAFLNQALLLAAEEKISWRAFYTNQKSVPKAHFLESLGLTLTDTSSPTYLNSFEGHDWSNNRKQALEKKFFYQTSKREG